MANHRETFFNSHRRLGKKSGRLRSCIKESLRNFLSLALFEDQFPTCLSDEGNPHSPDRDSSDFCCCVLEIFELMKFGSSDLAGNSSGFRACQGNRRQRLRYIAENNLLPGKQLPLEPGQVPFHR